ncbi:MAG: extracellular solute-binding protein [Erysipelotrichaceae bacterium]|nr:extracellular solute-binding protein [Erysipelotrichaceae bacterium]
MPIIVMAFFSFNKAKSLTHYTGFSTKWYGAMFANSQLLNAIFVSVSVALIATLVSTVLGTITAVALSKSKRLIKFTVQQINNLPIMNPEIVTAIALMIFFSFISFNKGYMTMLLAHIAFCTPYVITNVYPKVKALDPNLAEAAMDLGATPGETLLRVLIPEIRPGIIAGALIAFTMSFDDFIISYFVSGNGVENISIVVYNMSKRMNPSIYALSTVILVCIMIVLLIGTFMPYILYKKYGKIPRFVTRLGYIGLALLVIIAGFTSFRANTAKQVLKVFNAGEYADMEVVASFEREYNCRVIYETFDSNESMYTKLMGGNDYDVIVPSDYMIARLIKEDLVVKLDWDLIPNAKSLDTSIMYQDFDPKNDYWCPYFCGNVGIVYDKRNVTKKDLKDGWNILKNPKFKGDIYMYDSERDSMMVALKALGYSMNTTKPKEIKAAYDWLVDQRNTMKPTYAGDDSIDAMKSGNKSLCVMYSGDACAVMDENDNLGFFMPDEGTNYWVDGFVVTKTCENQTLANEFINYMISDENAYLHTVEVGYLTPNLNAAAKARKNDFPGNIAYEIRVDKNDESFDYQDNETKALFSSYWTKVKAK